MEGDSDQVPNYKVVIIGNTETGKTSIIQKWATGVFLNATKPTVGTNHQRKRAIVDGKPVDLFAWDTAGQEAFRSIMPLYVRGSCAIIVTASITNLDSFESLQEWIDLIGLACNPIPPLILAVNKMDLATTSSMTYEDIENKYGKKFQEVFFVSALTGENIEQLFTTVAAEASKFSLSHTDFTVPQPKKADEEKKNCC